LRILRYDVRVAPHSGGQEGHFELEQDEALAVGDTLRQFSMVYQVTKIEPLSVEESEDFDAIAHVEWRAGPAQVGFD
jgi:hypothetical protein